jgi:filamentous hemagglutinin family protein
MKSIVLGILMGAIALPTHAQNLVVPDATLGNDRSIVEPRPGFDAIKGGATRGTGLFHSFSEFGVGDRGSVEFVARPEIQNIFARVTGGNGSNILGAIGTAIEKGDGSLGSTTANLFLLNPNGIVFGPNARLNLAGSFLATTASSFRFGGDQAFSAVNPQNAPLLTVSAPIGLQFGQRVGGIEVKGATLTRSSIGQSLALVGGTVNITNSTIQNLGGGQIELGAIGSDAQVALTSGLNGIELIYPDKLELKDIALSNSTVQTVIANLPARPTAFGDLKIRGRSIAANNSFIVYFNTAGSQKGVLPGVLRLNASSNLLLSTGAVVFAGGNDTNVPVADISIKTNDLRLRNRASILSGNDFGAGGNIAIEAQGDILIEGSPTDASSIATVNLSGGSINTSEIKISAKSVTLTDGAIINSILSGNEPGQAGDVTIDVQESIRVLGEGEFPSNISSSAAARQGNVGSVKLNAQKIEVRDGGSIAVVGSAGTTGNLLIQASDSVTITGTTKAGIASEIKNVTFRSSPDNYPLISDDSVEGFGVRIAAKSLLLSDGAQIITISSGNGDSRGISIDTDALVVDATASKSFLKEDGRTAGFNLTQISTTKLNGTGDAGDIRIRARTVAVLAGGTIESNIAKFDSSSSGNPRTAPEVFQGKVGDIIIDATESILVQGAGSQTFTPETSLFPSSKINNTISIGGYAKGGVVRLNTKNLQIRDGGAVQSDLLGRGEAGAVEINVAENITVAGIGNDAIEGYASNISSFAGPLSLGDSGSVSIRAKSLNLEEGGYLSVANRGIGNAGRLSVNVNGDILVSGVSKNGDRSQINSSTTSLTSESQAIYIAELSRFGIDTSKAVTETLGDGGDIEIQAGSLRISDRAIIRAISDGLGQAGDIKINLNDRLIANNADITATSEKTSGGNIDLTARAIVLRNNANIKTSVASGDGQGGNIQLKAGGIVLLEDSDILAFARDGQGGNISLFTSALLTRTYKPSDPASNLETLDTNDFVDINATGRTSGIVTIPELNPLQNNRPEITPTLIDTDQVLSRSCLTRNPKTGKFIITGTGGLPPKPGDPPISTYSTLPVGTETTIAEADNLYTLTNGQVVIGKACQTAEVKS